MSVDTKWMKDQGWLFMDAGCYLYETDKGVDHSEDGADPWYVGIMLNTGEDELYTTSNDSDGIAVRCLCHTREQVLGIMRTFGLPVK